MRWKLYGKVYACVLCGYHWERHCQIYFSLKNKNFSSVSWNYNVSYLCDVYFPPTRSKHIKIISVSYISSGDFEMALLFVTTWKTEQHTTYVYKEFSLEFYSDSQDQHDNTFMNGVKENFSNLRWNKRRSYRKIWNSFMLLGNPVYRRHIWTLRFVRNKLSSNSNLNSQNVSLA